MATTEPDAESDYGDFGNDNEELEILDQLLAQVASGEPLAVTDIEDYESPRGARVPKVLGFEVRSPRLQTDIEIPHNLETTHTEVRSPKRDETEPTPEPDDRPPLERFRKPPKKALSVTDLVSPAWCELQYFYTLSKHGRKRRTPAMKQGSKVHKALEDEIHITVPIDVVKKEDSWGLRIWNIVQGLRTLRDTGCTRELEIWGKIGGELVNGIIDELSYDCPDPKYEENLKAKKNPEVDLPEYQISITEYLVSAGQKENGKSLAEAVKSRQQQERKWIYITDIKTRGTPTLPTGSAIRPTILQLHLYHHMLENLVQGNFQLSSLTERYDLDPNEPFSDSFLAQLGGLNQDLYEAASSQEEELRASQIMSSQDSLDVLLQNNNLSLLWDYMMSQFRMTFVSSHTQSDSHELPSSTPQSVSELPPPPTQPTCLSPLLTAEYIAPTYKHAAGTSKRSIGRKSFGFNAAFLKTYLEDSLAWWRGEREAKGVELQEAWKCRSCDFRDDCEWIHERDAAAVKDAMERKAMREIAGVEGKKGKRSKV